MLTRSAFMVFVMVGWLGIVAGSSPASAGTRVVEGSTTGKHFIEVLNRWNTVPIGAYVDDDGNAYVRGTDGGIVKARGFLAKQDVAKVAALLRKSQEWVKTAKAQKLEVTKELGSFMRGSGYDENGVALTFFSANKGQQTDVILRLVDFENQFFKVDLYLDAAQVKGLIQLLDRVPATVAELRRQDAAAALLE